MTSDTRLLDLPQDALKYTQKEKESFDGASVPQSDANRESKSRINQTSVGSGVHSENASENRQTRTEKSETDNLLEAAEKKGFDSGYEKGIAEGKSQAEKSFENEKKALANQQAELNQQKEKLNASIEMLNNEAKKLQALSAEIKGQTEAIAFSMTSKIVSDIFVDLMDDKEQIKKMIAGVANEYFGTENVSLKVGQSLYSCLKESHDNVQSSNLLGEWEVEICKDGKTILVDYKNYFLKLSELM